MNPSTSYVDGDLSNNFKSEFLKQTYANEDKYWQPPGFAVQNRPRFEDPKSLKLDQLEARKKLLLAEMDNVQSDLSQLENVTFQGGPGLVQKQVDGRPFVAYTWKGSYKSVAQESFVGTMVKKPTIRPGARWHEKRGAPTGVFSHQPASNRPGGILSMKR